MEISQVQEAQIPHQNIPVDHFLIEVTYRNLFVTKTKLYVPDVKILYTSYLVLIYSSNRNSRRIYMRDEVISLNVRSIYD